MGLGGAGLGQGWEGRTAPRTGRLLPVFPEASAALQVRATKDYCNNYDLTSLNVKAGDIITVRTVPGCCGRDGRDSGMLRTPSCGSLGRVQDSRPRLPRGGLCLSTHPVCLVRYLNSIQTAGGKAVSMTTGQAMTGWATSHPRWGRLLSSEPVSPPHSGERQAGDTQLRLGTGKEEVYFRMLGAEPG